MQVCCVMSAIPHLGWVGLELRLVPIHNRERGCECCVSNSRIMLSQFFILSPRGDTIVFRDCILSTTLYHNHRSDPGS